MAGSEAAFSGTASSSDLLRFAFDRQLRQDLVEHRRQLPLGPSLAQVGDGLALEHGINGRDRLDPELGSDELVLVDVDLHQPDAAIGISGGDLLEDRRQLLARPAPFRPEIDDDELSHAWFDDVAPELLDRFLVGFAQSQSRHLYCLRTVPI